MQQRYWRFLISSKADGVYASCYAERSEVVDNRLNIFTALIATGSVSTWAIWQKLDFLWAALVAASQVLTVIKQYLPFRKRIGPVRALAYAYEEIFLKGEAQWHAVASGALTEIEINKLISDQKTEQFKAWKKYIGDLTLPVNVKIRAQADRLTADYFSQTYNMPVNIRE